MIKFSLKVGVADGMEEGTVFIERRLDPYIAYLSRSSNIYRPIYWLSQTESSWLLQSLTTMVAIITLIDVLLQSCRNGSWAGEPSVSGLISLV